VSGPTGCGKSSFVLRFTDNADTMIIPTPDKIIYYFTVYQSIFDRYPHINFRQGVPKLDEIDDIRNALVILDDMNRLDQHLSLQRFVQVSANVHRRLFEKSLGGAASFEIGSTRDGRLRKNPSIE